MDADIHLVFDGSPVAGIVLDPVQDTFPWYEGTVVDGPGLPPVRGFVVEYHAVGLEFGYCPHHPDEAPYEESDLAAYVRTLTALRDGSPATPDDPDVGWPVPERAGDPDWLEGYLRFLDFRRWCAVTRSQELVVGIELPPALDLATRRFAYRP